jgi:hypothetical protein
MKYRKPTYEEYCKATTYAKIRYRFGVYIQLVAAILLLFLIYYTVTNVEEMKANPVEYAKEKLGVICNQPITFQVENYNGSYGNITSIREG